MIVTVTMNPAIDRMIYVDHFHAGAVNRSCQTRVYAGGKGINVSRVVRLLGGDTCAMGVVAGDTGKQLCALLEREGLPQKMYSMGDDAYTRVNVKVYAKNGDTTDINEPGPCISPEQAESFVNEFEAVLSPGDTVVLSGSLCGGIDSRFYLQLAQTAKKRGCAVIADASGENLRLLLQAKPTFVKPNLKELEQLLGRRLAAFPQICEAARALLHSGAQKVVVSLGEKGALMVTPQRVLYAPALEVSVKGTVGAGDSMVAGLAFSMGKKASDEQALKLACACATACVCSGATGDITADMIRSYEKQIRTEEWKEEASV